ncbi:hypothetical protein Y032_0473g2098 [Ancylostoma ceylanicum]|uniref:Uncharacterized protein n=1 Tax=Ancylostoma ceylanicum TaxID=53326 RepID=A0A016WXU9_9BILA|nr:hypothetical protein Y032_0473g2098 [Ancylostoma ceylanicum]
MFLSLVYNHTRGCATRKSFFNHLCQKVRKFVLLVNSSEIFDIFTFNVLEYPSGRVLAYHQVKAEKSTKLITPCSHGVWLSYSCSPY